MNRLRSIFILIISEILRNIVSVLTYSVTTNLCLELIGPSARENYGRERRAGEGRVKSEEEKMAQT